MNCVVTIDWKFVVALGASISCIILCEKIEPDAAERVSTHAVDAVKECATARNSGC